MNGIQVVEAIKAKFATTNGVADISLLKGGTFTAELTGDGIRVDNLGNQPILPWIVFQEAVCVLIRMNGRAPRGDAMKARLGDQNLSLDSVEGHIAQVVYGKKVGETVFRRISPITGILIWVGICDAAPNELILKQRE